MITLYIFSSIFILIYGFISGFGISYLIGKKIKMGSIVAFSLSPFFLTIFLMIYGLALYIFNLFETLPLLLPLIILLPLSAKFVRKMNREVKLVLFIFILQFFSKVLLQLFIPFYPLGNDWYKHHQTSSQILSYNFTLTLDGRPPIYNFINAIYLAMIGNHFWVSQIVSVLLNSFLILPTYILARELFDKKVALLSLLFLSLNVYLIENALYTWPKNFASYFILLFYYLILKKRNLLEETSAALALLTHPLALFFIIPGYLYKFLTKEENLSKSIGSFLILIIPLFIYSYLTVGKLPGSDFFYYPFAVEGWRDVLGKSFSEVFNKFLSKPIQYIIGVRAVNALNTIFPSLLILKTFSMVVPLPILKLHKIIDIQRLPWIYHYYHSIPGALSLALCAFCYISMYKFYKERKMLSLLILMPLILSLIFYGWIVPGMTRQTLQPLIPLLIVLGLNELQKNKKMLWFCFGVMILEGVIFAYLHNEFILSFPHMIEKMEKLRIHTINKLVFKI